MGYVDIAEPVEVVASFSPEGMIHPLSFAWAGREHQVREITYRWRTGKGRSTLRFFAVTTETEDAYQLCYRDEDSTWWLERGWTPG